MLKFKKLSIKLLIIILIFNLFSIPMKSNAELKKTTTLPSISLGRTSLMTSVKSKNIIPQVVRTVLYSSKTTLSINDSIPLNLLGITGDGTAFNLTTNNVDYKSSDKSIIKVQKIGKMITATALSPGDAYVIAKISIGGKIKSASLRLSVVTAMNSKTRSTYYTRAKIQAARYNIEKYTWARDIKKAAVEKSEKYLKLSYDQLWNLVTPQSVPRSYAVNQPLGCLNCGKQIDKFGIYPYLSDPLKESFKIECPNCHTKFPTNDYGAYYESGKNKLGIFDPKLADKTLLVNKLYPEKGAAWGVDDGNGYIDGNNNRYTFIAYYNHWGLWYRGTIIKALNSLRDAYIFTGDLRYARAGIILLDRIADVYPSMDVSQYKIADGFLNSNGGSNQGKIVGSIWETDLSKDLLRAYDAFFPAMEDYEVTKFLSIKQQKSGSKNLKRTGIDIKSNIEEGIVRQIFPAIKKAQIKGNNGMHQSTLALAAVVIDTLPDTKEWLDFDFQTGTATNTQVTGGNILATLVNDVDRDGNGNEASPQYNKGWLSEYIEMANILKGYELYPKGDLYQNVKLRKMFSAMYPLLLTDIYSALIGDSGATGGPINYLDKAQCTLAFEQFKDPILAQLVYFLNNNKLDGIRGDIFSEDPDRVNKDIRSIVNTYGTLKLNSTNSTGYGFAALRDGVGKIAFRLLGDGSSITSSSPDTQRTLWLYYGRNQGHGHFDTLNIGLNAFKLDLMPDLGYPEYADETPNRTEWIRNTISHNTVVVDKLRQSGQIVGQPKHFDDSEMVKLIDVEAPKVYPKTSLYRRTTAMIRIDNENFYAVDFFRVNGGNDHYYSFHGAEGSVSTENLKLKPQLGADNQPSGTYLSPDTQFGVRPQEDSVPGFAYIGSGFHWLKNVEKDSSPLDLFSIDWKAKDTWNVYGNGFGADTDVHLKLTMLGKMTDISLAEGLPPRNNAKNPRSLKYLIAHRQGDNISSLFTSIIEPYKYSSNVVKVTPAAIKLNGQPVNDNIAGALKLVLKNGRVDYIINSLDSNSTYTVDDKFQFKGFFGVYSEVDGKQVFGYLNDGTLLGNTLAASEGSLTGTVQDFTKELSISNDITVRFDNKSMNPNDIVGNYIYIENDGIRNASYQIKGIKKTDGDLMTLDIGDITPIRSFVDPNDLTKGYVYDIPQGAKFSIPLVRIWKK